MWTKHFFLGNEKQKERSRSKTIIPKFSSTSNAVGSGSNIKNQKRENNGGN